MTPRVDQAPAIRLFCSCTIDDERSLSDFEKALAGLKRSGILAVRSSQRLLAGTETKAAINEAIDHADVIVLLISSSFLDSDSCWNDELPRAMVRYKHHAARLIPVLVGPCLWDDAPFATITPLPPNAKPVSSWLNKDDAWTSVAIGIREVIKDIQFEHLRRVAPKSVREKATGADVLEIIKLSDELTVLSDGQPGMSFSSEELLKWGDARFVSGNVNEAIRLYRKAIAVAPETAIGWHKLGFAFDEGCQKYQEALRFYDVALALDPTLVETHIDRSYVLRHLGKLMASVDAASSALDLEPGNARATYNRACSHARAGNELEALTDLKAAIKLQPTRYRKMAVCDPDLLLLHGASEYVALVGFARETTG